MERTLLVGCGGFLGAVARHLAVVLAQRLLPAGFPYGTFLVNVSGCFAIGVLAALADERAAFGPQARLFLVAGVLGGYTTFSSFGWEGLALLRDGALARALVYIGGQVVLGLAAVWAGMALVRSLP